MLKSDIFRERDLRAKMTAHKFRIGDPVWAKMKGFSPWPGKVSQELM